MYRYRTDCVKELRKALRLTRTAFAEKLEISRQSFRSLENGEHVPNGNTLLKLMNCFNLDPGFFFEETSTSTLNKK